MIAQTVRPKRDLNANANGDFLANFEINLVLLIYLLQLSSLTSLNYYPYLPLF